MTTIVKVIGREILDSRGNPTVEADVYLADGSMGRAAVPSGASTGEHEAVELRDGDKSRYLGKGTLQGRQPHQRRDRHRRCTARTPPQQAEIDRIMIELDGTPNKGRLGANAILAVSMAAARAAAALAAHAALPLPGRRRRLHPAGPHDEHHQRRRARRQLRGRAGVHDRALRRAEVLRSAAHGRGGVPHAEEGAEEEGLLHRGGRRGRLRAQPEVQRRGPRVRARSHHARPATSPASRSASASTRPPASSTRTASTSSRSPTRASAPPSRWWNSGPTGCSKYPAIISIEDGMAEDDWAGWKLHDRHARQEDPARGRRHLRHQPVDLRSAASSRASPIRS